MVPRVWKVIPHADFRSSLLRPLAESGAQRQESACGVPREERHSPAQFLNSLNSLTA